jgi:hypothetical protein
MLSFVCILTCINSDIHLSLNSELFWWKIWARTSLRNCLSSVICTEILIMKLKLWWLVSVLYICNWYRTADITIFTYTVPRIESGWAIVMFSVMRSGPEIYYEHHDIHFFSHVINSNWHTKHNSVHHMLQEST